MHYRKSNIAGGCILLDSAIFVHIFNDKKKFSYFKKLLKQKILLYRGKIVLITS